MVTPAGEAGIEVQIVTADTVAGKRCPALSVQQSLFPVRVLMRSKGETDGAIRGMKTLRAAAVAAWANTILGLTTAPYINRIGNPRTFLYVTLASSLMHCWSGTTPACARLPSSAACGPAAAAAGGRPDTASG